MRRSVEVSGRRRTGAWIAGAALGCAALTGCVQNTDPGQPANSIERAVGISPSASKQWNGTTDVVDLDCRIDKHLTRGLDPAVIAKLAPRAVIDGRVGHPKTAMPFSIWRSQVEAFFDVDDKIEKQPVRISAFYMVSDDKARYRAEYGLVSPDLTESHQPYGHDQTIRQLELPNQTHVYVSTTNTDNVVSVACPDFVPSFTTLEEMHTRIYNVTYAATAPKGEA